jgi:hypothetical protein
VTAREEQVREALKVRERQVSEALDREAEERVYAEMDEEALAGLYSSHWELIRKAYALAEPVLHELIARRVREVVPDATAVWIEPTDQGGPGWVCGYRVRSPGGETDDTDALSDDDTLSDHFTDLGEFFSSESNPAQFFELPAKP